MPTLPTLGLELPPLTTPAVARDAAVAAPADERFTSLARVVEAAEQASFEAVWLNGGSGRGPAADPCTLAGGLTATPSQLLLGVVENLQLGRRPTILARDLTALDLVSGGRAAVALADADLAPAPDRDPGEASVALARLAEAASIVGALLAGDLDRGRRDTAFFPWPGAALSPAPRRKEGPLVVALVPWWVVTAAHQASLDHCAGAVDALAVGGDTDGFLQARERLANGAAPPAVIWRGTLPLHAERATAALQAVLDAGADGMICRLPRGKIPSPSEVLTVGRAARRAAGT